MTNPFGASNFQNTEVFPNQLFTAYADTNGLFGPNVSCAVINMSQLNLDRYIHRVVLTTTLTSADMVGGNGGLYWNPGASIPVQAPFYLFLGTRGLSNIVDLSMIGSVNVGEYLFPIKVPAGTELWGLWNGVSAGAASKCQATMYCTGKVNG